MEVFVLVQDLPEQPVITGIDNITTTSFIIRWTEPYSHNNPILSYTIYLLTDKISFNTTLTFVEITELLPNTVYMVSVAASNEVGESRQSEVVSVTTLEAAPIFPPANVIATIISSTQILVSWAAVSDITGIITHYEVEFTPQNTLQGVISGANLTTPNTSIVLVDLEEYVIYYIRVRAHSNGGTGPYSIQLAVQTLEDIPSATPVSFNLRSLSSTSVFGGWGPIPEIDRNGVIVNYTLEYTLNVSGSEGFISVNVSGTSVLLEGLEIFTQYWVRVSASTSIGNGPFTPFSSITTLEDVPAAAPDGLHSTNVTSTAIVLAWSEVDEGARNGIIVQYRIMYENENDRGTVTVPGSALSTTVTSLEEYTSYNFQISAATSVGFGPYSDLVRARTLEDVPSAPPENVLVFTNSSTSMVVTWQPLSSVADENGIITHYEVEYSSIYGQDSVEIDGYAVGLDDLEEFTQYSVRVSAHTSIGAGPFSSPVTITTDEDLPSEPPATVNAVSLDSTQIQVAWDEVPPQHQNGIITRYEIEYRQEEEEDRNSVIIIYPNQLLYNLVNLEAFQTYQIRIRAYTIVGAGPYSDLVTAIPDQSPPSGPPLNVTSEAISSTSIRVMWDEVAPVDRNGIITKYDVQFSQSVFDEGVIPPIESLLKAATLTNLHEFTEYSILVRAYTVAGPGPYSNATHSTTLQENPAEPPTDVTLTALSSTSLLVEWDEVALIYQNGIITRYEVEYGQDTFDLEPYANIVVDGGNMSQVMVGLEEYVEYTVLVRAYTIVGAGPYSSEVKVTTLEDVPTGFPTGLQSSPATPNQVILQWSQVNAIDRNGVIIAYEILYNQSSIQRLTLSGTLNSTQLSATVGPLQPFIPYDVVLRAFTRIGPGPYIHPSITVSTEPSGLSLSGETYYEVKEGEDLDVVCTPSVSTVGLDWDLPQSVLDSGATTTYQEPLRHTLTLRQANIHHNATYTCVVAGDRVREITPVAVKVKVLEKCFEDFTGGLFWEVAFDGDRVSQPCKNADPRFSSVVRVYRTCLSNRRWTTVDFSGCVLENNDPLVLIIISLRATTINQQEIDIPSLQEEMTQVVGGSVAPATSSLELLSQTLDQHSLLVWRMSYTTVQEAMDSGVDSLFCNSTFGSNTQLVLYGSPNIVAFTRSDYCECRNVEVIANDAGNEGSGGDEICLQQQLDIQEICDGTLASPCNCQPFTDCQCMSPYIGDGSLCVLDTDQDGYPEIALRSCSSSDTETYCSQDTCPFAPNINQDDRSPCIGDDTDCEEESDQVWDIFWPFTPGGMTATVSCGVNFVGNASRFCRENLLWAEPNVTNCQSRVFVDIMERAEEAFESADTEVVLEVVEELVVATAQEDTPQLPRDLNTTNEIITDTLDLLFNDLDTAPGDNQTNVTITIDAATVVFEALDNILSESNQVSFQSLQEVDEGVGSQAVLMNAESFGLFAARVLASNDGGTTGPNRVVNITGENMALRAQSVAVNEDTTYSFPSPEEIQNLALPNATLANISLSPAFLGQSVSGDQGSTSVVVASVLFATLQSFLPSSSSDGVEGEPASLIISTQIAVEEQKISGQSDSNGDNEEGGGVMIEFLFPTVEADPILERRVVSCVFYHFGTGPDGLADSGWSTENITTVMETNNGSESTVRCSSSHLTSFAVLVDVQGVEINNKPLSIVSYVGLSLSSVCLIFTIIFLLSLRNKLFTALHNFVHLNLAISLLAGYIVFAVGVELAVNNTIGCKAVTAMIQYFFLAAFSWMLCEGVMLYLMLVKVFNTLKNKWWFFFLLGWGIPLPFCVIGLGAFHKQYGVKDITGKFKYCWLSSGTGNYAFLTFIVPMLIIILINVVFLVLVLRSIFKSKSNQKTVRRTMKREKKNSLTDTAVQLLKATVILLPLLGLTWVFGLLAVNRDTVVFAWLFTIFNTLQGFFIFFFHVLRSKIVSTKVKRRYTLYSSTMTSKFGTLTSSLRSPTSPTSTLSRPLKEMGSFTGSLYRSSRTSSVLSEAESDFKSETIIVHNPQLPVIKEEEDEVLELRLVRDKDNLVFTTIEFDDEEEDSSLGTVAVETKSVTVIKANPGAIND